VIVQTVLEILPCQPFRLQFFARVREHGNRLLGKMLHRAQFAVVVAAVRVVPDEHHAGALLQPEFAGGRIQTLGIIPLDLGGENLRLAGKGIQPGFVQRVGLLVVGGQVDPIFSCRCAGPGIQPVQQGIGDAGVADAVQDLDEGPVRLAVDGLQLDGHVGQLLQGTAVEEIRSGIDLFQEGPFLLRDHGRQLAGVSDHQELDAAERLGRAPVAPERHIHRVQQICTDHGNLVDDQEVQGPQDLDFVLAEPPVAIRHLVFGLQLGDVREIGAERKREERVDGAALRVDGRHARRGQYDAALGRLLHDVAEKSGLSRPGLAGQEHGHGGLLHILLGQFKQPVLLQHRMQR